MTIYKITNIINGKVYVGQTKKSLNRRWKEHVYYAKRGSNSTVCLHKAINKYGVESFTVETIDTAANLEELNKKESEWISKLNSFSNTGHGYNMTLGGNSVNGYVCSEEAKEKHRQNAIKRRFGHKPLSEETKKILRESGLRQFANKEFKDKWLLINGSRHFDAFKAVNVSPRSPGKPAVWVKGEFVGTWFVVAECAKELGIGHQHISSVLKGKRSQSGGYIFMEKKEV